MADESLHDKDPRVKSITALIPIQSWRTACAKRKPQAEPHWRIERAIEDAGSPDVHCGYMFMKETAASDGLNVLNMYEAVGYGISTAVETKGTGVFAVIGKKQSTCLGLSDTILQCDPEPSLITWAEKCEVRSTRTNSAPRRSQQSDGAVKNY